MLLHYSEWRYNAQDTQIFLFHTETPLITQLL